MPIRTNRGRAAVYRRIWGWPLRSGRHLVISVLGLVVVAVLVGIGIQNVKAAIGRHGATSHGASAGLSGMSGAPLTTTRLASPQETPTPAPPAPAALAVITAWGKAWVNHPLGMTNQQWLDQLKPYTTAEFLPTMGSVDLTNIAATQITGPPLVVASYTSSVEALLPTNAKKLDITVISTPQGWLVSTYTEAP